jgi:hypothetical protein
MNKKNIQELINLLETIKEDDFDLSVYTHPCGAPACVAGHATTLDSWRLEGGLVDKRSAGIGPSFRGYSGVMGFALWAEIPIVDAELICGTGTSSETAMFYGAFLRRDVTAKQAAAALRMYLTTEIEDDK